MASSGYLVPFAQNRSISRRDALRSGLAAVGGTAMAATCGQTISAQGRPGSPDDRRASPTKYPFKKSINL